MDTCSMTGRQKCDLRQLLIDALDDAHLSEDVAQKVLGNGDKLRVDIAELLKSALDLLELVTTISTPAIQSFSAQDHFKQDTSGEVKIGYIGINFHTNFLAGDGKIEANIAEATLRVHKLMEASVNGPIIAELGGEDIAETSLAQMYELMKAQGQGQKGILSTNGFANIFYVRDAKGVLWAVDCDWGSGSGYWDVNAYPVAFPDTWDAGYQVLSR